MCHLQKKKVLYIDHNINPDKQEKFNEVFISCFPNRTAGYANDDDSIKLYLKEQIRIKKDKPKTAVNFYIQFDKTGGNNDIDDTIDLEVCFKSIEKKIKKYGYVDAYDLTTRKGVWDVSLNINTDDLPKIHLLLKNIVDLSGYKVKNIKVVTYEE